MGLLYFVVAAVFGFRTCGTGEIGEDHIEKGLGVFLLVLDVYKVHRACRNDNGIGMEARVP